MFVCVENYQHCAYCDRETWTCIHEKRLLDLNFTLIVSSYSIKNIMSILFSLHFLNIRIELSFHISEETLNFSMTYLWKIFYRVFSKDFSQNFSIFFSLNCHRLSRKKMAWVHCFNNTISKQYSSWEFNVPNVVGIYQESYCLKTMVLKSNSWDLWLFFRYKCSTIILIHENNLNYLEFL